MTTPRNITIEILKDIRDAVRETNGRLDETNGRIDQMSARIDQTSQESQARFDELGRRIVESELRTATALTDLAGTVREMTSVLRAQGDLRPRLEKCERDIAELHRRLPEAS